MSWEHKLGKKRKGTQNCSLKGRTSSRKSRRKRRRVLRSLNSYAAKGRLSLEGGGKMFGGSKKDPV